MINLQICRLLHCWVCYLFIFAWALNIKIIYDREICVRGEGLTLDFKDNQMHMNKSDDIIFHRCLQFLVVLHSYFFSNELPQCITWTSYVNSPINNLLDILSNWSFHKFSIIKHLLYCREASLSLPQSTESFFLV